MADIQQGWGVWVRQFLVVSPRLSGAATLTPGKTFTTIASLCGMRTQPSSHLKGRVVMVMVMVIV